MVKKEKGMVGIKKLQELVNLWIREKWLNEAPIPASTEQSWSHS